MLSKRLGNNLGKTVRTHIHLSSNTTLLCSELNYLHVSTYFSEEIFTVSWSRKLEYMDIPSSRKCPKHKVWLGLLS